MILYDPGLAQEPCLDFFRMASWAEPCLDFIFALPVGLSRVWIFVSHGPAGLSRVWMFFRAAK